MTILDIILLIIWVFFMFRGVRKGFFREIFSLAGVVAGFGIAYLYLDEVMAALGLRSPGILIRIGLFLAILVVVYFVVALAGVILSKIVKLLLLGFLDRFLGLVFGLLEGIVVSLVVVYLLSLFERGLGWVNSSSLGSLLLDMLKTFGANVLPGVPQGGSLL